jgi:small subunit ribosomal protein S27e
MNHDLTNPSYDEEKRTHKLKRLIPSPNSYFMEVKCGGCNTTTNVFSHAQTVITCDNCKNVIAKPTGGKCKLTHGSAFKVRSWFNTHVICYVNNLIVFNSFILLLTYTLFF